MVVWCDLGLRRSPPPLADLIASRGGQVVRRTHSTHAFPGGATMAVDTSMVAAVDSIDL